MTDQLSDQELLKFLGKHKLCVVATTAQNGQPEAAVVGFSAHEGLQIIIATDELSRKYTNIVQNPHVALVVGWDANKTVQLDGTARVLVGDELALYQAKHFAKQPESRRYKDDPGEQYILIKPRWIRYTDCTVHPWHVVEQAR